MDVGVGEVEGPCNLGGAGSRSAGASGDAWDPYALVDSVGVRRRGGRLPSGHSCGSGGPCRRLGRTASTCCGGSGSYGLSWAHPLTEQSFVGTSAKPPYEGCCTTDIPRTLQRHDVSK